MGQDFFDGFGGGDILYCILVSRDVNPHAFCYEVLK